MKKDVTKRDGRVVSFDEVKVFDAISKAMAETEKGLDEVLVEKIVEKVKQKAEKQNLSVEQIQDVIEVELMKSARKDVAKVYIAYRHQRNLARESKTKDVFMSIISAEANEVTRENANMSAETPSGMMIKFASETTKPFADNYLLTEEALTATRGNYIHPHDKDYMVTRSLTCCSMSSTITVQDHNRNTEFTNLGYFNKFFKEELSNEPQTISLNNEDIYIKGRNSFTKVTSVTRRYMTDSDIFYHVKTRKGLGLEITDQHLIPVIDKESGIEVLKKVKELSVGDKLLRESILDTGKNILEGEYLDLGKEFLKVSREHPESPIKEDQLFISNLKKLRKYVDYRYDIGNLEKHLGIHTKRHGSSYLTLSEWTEFEKKYPIPSEVKETLSIKVKDGKGFLPLYLPITNELAELIGYMHSEGSTSYHEAGGSYQMAFTNYNETMNQRFEDSWNKIFSIPLIKRFTKNSKGERICSGRLVSNKIIVALFKYVFGKDGSSDITIPSFIYDADIDVKWHYISALYDGDGSLHAEKDRKLNYTTVSESLAKGLVTILSSLEIDSTISKHDTAGTIAKFGEKESIRKYDTYVVNVFGKENFTKFSENLKCIKSLSSDPFYAAKPKKSIYNEPDEIIQLKELSKEGIIVYDLETIEHWWTANGYVVHNCLQHPLDRILENGFKAGHGESRPAKRIETASILAAISMETIQNKNLFPILEIK